MISDYHSFLFHDKLNVASCTKLGRKNVGQHDILAVIQIKFHISPISTRYRNVFDANEGQYKNRQNKHWTRTFGIGMCSCNQWSGRTKHNLCEYQNWVKFQRYLSPQQPKHHYQWWDKKLLNWITHTS